MVDGMNDNENKYIEYDKNIYKNNNKTFTKNKIIILCVFMK